MIRLCHALVLVSLLYGTLFKFLEPVAARDNSLRSLNTKRFEAMKRRESSHSRNVASHARRATDTSAPQVKNISFSNPKASGAYATDHAFVYSSSHALSEFYVDGTTLPLVNFDVGPSWAGSIPINASASKASVPLLRNFYK
jgi:carboxypeptidase D